MNDRDEVIKRLTEVSDYMRAKADIAGVGKGKEVFDSWYRAAEDALAMLKEQEPAKPREERHEVKVSHDWGDEVEVWSEFYCPHCGAMIAKGKSEHYPRCMWCGKAVKWND